MTRNNKSNHSPALINHAAHLAYAAMRAYWGPDPNDVSNPGGVWSAIKRDVVKVLDGDSAGDLYVAWKRRKTGKLEFFRETSVQEQEGWFSFVRAVNAALKEVNKMNHLNTHAPNSPLLKLHADLFNSVLRSQLTLPDGLAKHVVPVCPFTVDYKTQEAAVRRQVITAEKAASAEAKRRADEIAGKRRQFCLNASSQVASSLQPVLNRIYPYRTITDRTLDGTFQGNMPASKAIHFAVVAAAEVFDAKQADKDLEEKKEADRKQNIAAYAKARAVGRTEKRTHPNPVAPPDVHYAVAPGGCYLPENGRFVLLQDCDYETIIAALRRGVGSYHNDRVVDELKRFVNISGVNTRVR